MSGSERAAMLAAVHAVPKPATIGLLGVASLSLMRRRRRRRANLGESL